MVDIDKSAEAINKALLICRRLCY